MQKGFIKKDPPKTLGTRINCEAGTGLDGQKSRQAGLDKHRAIHT